MATKNSVEAAPVWRRTFLVFLSCLVIIFGVLFHKSFLPGYILHNNDTPVGTYSQPGMQTPEAFTGVWLGLNWLGVDGGFMTPTLSSLALWVGGPVWYSKFWQVLSLMLLGFSGWAFCRSSKFSGVACVLGGLAFALHGDPFSNSCWGQVSRPLSLSAMLLALTALQAGSGVQFWLRGLLAGAVVGWGIIEGFDVAALYSLVIAAYSVYQVWISREGSAVGKLSAGLLRLGLVAGFAGLVAACSLSSLVGVAIKGVAGMGQDAQTKEQQWDWATQWSFPKSETLGLFIPGVFGYRMDTPEGGQYWGKSGRDPAWDRYFESDRQGPPPRGYMRFGGAGTYMGTVIPVVALWALLQSFRRKDSPFSEIERKFIWFWGVLGFVCLLLSWGRFAPFYKFFYMLPYASTIRNPGKFLHLFNWASLMLFTYGLQGLSQRLTGDPAAAVRSAGDQWKLWRKGASLFDRRWLAGSVIAVIVVMLGWMMYASSADSLKRYLAEVQFDPGSASAIARFSIRQVGWFVLFLSLSLLSMVLILSGCFSGRRARFGAILLGAVLVTDLARANLPWIIHWNYALKYATNPLVEQLAAKAHEHRVAIVPEWIPDAFQLPAQVVSAEQLLNQLYRIEWAQHLFLERGVQSLDVIQMPRPPADYVTFETALTVRSGDTLTLATRHWELTNTRYLLGMAGFVELLNKQFDPGRERFRVAERFDIVPKAGFDRPTRHEELTAALSTNGTYALIEFTGALPRARLYTNWQVATNEQAAMAMLASREFDPQRTVILAEEPAVSAGLSTGQEEGTVEITTYEPKRIVIQAKTPAPAVLLLNDRYTDQWQVRIDGQPGRLLRCNYLMRGVQVPAGAHTVEFHFKTNTRPLHVTLVAEFLALGLLGYVLVSRRKAG